MNSEKILEVFGKSCKFFGFSFCRLAFLSKGNAFHEQIHPICWFSGCDFHIKMKKSSEIYAFWTKNWRFFENFAPFVCSKATIEHAASGWCAAVTFWKKSTWFAGLLAVIFTSRWKNLQEFMHSETILEIAANQNNWEQVLRSHFLGPWLHCTGSPCPRAA